MTEPTHKKNRDGRYHFSGQDTLAGPSGLPPVDIDDEDVIDSLLVNTVPNREEPPHSGEQHVPPVHTYPDLFSERGALNDEALSTQPSRRDDNVPPVELSNPHFDEKALPDGVARNDDAILSPPAGLTENPQVPPLKSASPPVQPIDPAAGAPKENAGKAALKSSTHAKITLENDLSATHTEKLKADAVKENSRPADSQDESHPDMSEFPYLWNRMVAMQKNYRIQSERLEAKIRQIRNLSIAALGVAALAIAIALIAAYLNIKTRADQDAVYGTLNSFKGEIEKLSETAAKQKQLPDSSAIQPTPPDDDSLDLPVSKESDILDDPDFDTPIEEPARVEPPKPRPAANPHSTSHAVPQRRKPKTQAIAAKSAPKHAERHIVKKRPVKPKPTAARTAIKAIKPSAKHRGGKWSVNLASFKHKDEAEKKADEFRQKGFKITIVKANINGQAWYRVGVGGYSDLQDAYRQAEQLKQRLHLKSAWVARQ